MIKRTLQSYCLYYIWKMLSAARNSMGELTLMSVSYYTIIWHFFSKLLSHFWKFYCLQQLIAIDNIYIKYHNIFTGKNRFSTCYIMMQNLICMLWLDFGIQSSTALLLQNFHRIVTSEFNYMAIFEFQKTNLKCKRLSRFLLLNNFESIQNVC